MKHSAQDIMVGPALKALRLKVGQSQDTVARGLEVNARTYCRWEWSEVNPGFDALMALHGYFKAFVPGLTLDHLADLGKLHKLLDKVKR
jgi:transcriptional regulator with XRE-family HTH domain